MKKNSLTYWSEGFYAYKPDKKFSDLNPYNKIEDRGDSFVQSLQVEAVSFFNGWEAAKSHQNYLTGYSLFLDDFRFPEWVTWVPLNLEDNWIISPHFYDFIQTIIRCGLPRTISFDYDLDRHNLNIKDLPYGNGADCAKWLVKHCADIDKVLPPFTIHSTNPEGRGKILEELTKKS